MKFLLSVILLFVLITNSVAQKRLILFTVNNTHAWLTDSQIFELKKQQIPFMDITMFQDVPKAPLPKQSPFPEKPTQQEIVNKLIQRLSLERYTETIKTLSSYPNRLYNNETGRDAVFWLQREYLKIISALPESRRELFSTQLVNHTHSNPKWIQPSLIVTLKGKDPELSKEIVIFGGHIDSLALRGTIAPGADDGNESCESLLTFV